MFQTNHHMLHVKEFNGFLRRQLPLAFVQERLGPRRPLPPNNGRSGSPRKHDMVPTGLIFQWESMGAAQNFPKLLVHCANPVVTGGSS